MELIPEGWKPGCDVRINRLNSFGSVEYTVQEGPATRVTTERIKPDAVAYLEFRDFKELRHFLVTWFNEHITPTDIDRGYYEATLANNTNTPYRKVLDWFNNDGQVALQSGITVGASVMAGVIASWAAEALGAGVSTVSTATVDADLGNPVQVIGNGLNLIMYNTTQNNNMVSRQALGGEVFMQPGRIEETLTATFSGNMQELQSVFESGDKLLVAGKHWMLTEVNMNYGIGEPIHAEVTGKRVY